MASFQEIIYLFIYLYHRKHLFEAHIHSLCLVVPSIPKLCNAENIFLKMSKNIIPNSCLLQSSLVYFFLSLRYVVYGRSLYKPFTDSNFRFKAVLSSKLKTNKQENKQQEN